MLLLAIELVVTRYMTLKNGGRGALVTRHELVRQSGARKVGFRLRNDRLLRPSVQGDEQRTARETNLDRAGALEIQPLVDAHIFREDFGSDLHRCFLGVRDLAEPVLLPALAIVIADGFDQFRVGSELRAERE